MPVLMGVHVLYQTQINLFMGMCRVGMMGMAMMMGVVMRMTVMAMM